MLLPLLWKMLNHNTACCNNFVRCYCQVADGIATGSSYSNFSSGVLSRTSSHMCGRWYLPMFSLRDGLLTLTNNASFINLLRFLSSLPTMLKFLYGDMVTSGVKMVIYRGGCFEVFFEPLFKCSWTLQCIPHCIPPCHTCIYKWLHFFLNGILVLWSHQEVLDGITSLMVFLPIS